MINENCKQILNNALNFVKTNYIYLNADDRDQPKINNLINLQNMDDIKNDNDGIIIINSLRRTVYNLDWMIGELEQSLNEDDEKQVLYEDIRREAQDILRNLRTNCLNNGGKRKRKKTSKKKNTKKNNTKRKRTNKSRRYKRR